jgi:hypothetical protein
MPVQQRNAQSDCSPAKASTGGITQLCCCCFFSTAWQYGYLDSQITAAALLLLQIAEETGLTAQQLQLVSFGRPLPVDDGRKRFLVHPFLFQLTDPAAAVTLNWENEAYDWVAPRWVCCLFGSACKCMVLSACMHYSWWVQPL